MVKLNRIYTGTGDDGTTGLVDGSRLPKHDARMEAIGAVDEANCAIGLAICALEGSGHAAPLTRIQNDLFDLGADLATPVGDAAIEDFSPSEMTLRIVPAQAEWIEASIDAINKELTPLTSFILPGGTEAAARLHIARASTRAAERRISALAVAERVNPAAMVYINRLSDYLFVMARAVNGGGAKDVLWAPGENR
ncbi:MAG: cob(I)yrinic acid a,c-diamide adenosyltransferase [Sphingomonadaceae bacterium]|nr:cob(I)yrinic acid a,c-diamide adenosyltransferase [Sphingomonadaceae bacterium]